MGKAADLLDSVYIMGKELLQQVEKLILKLPHRGQQHHQVPIKAWFSQVLQ